MAQEVQEYSKKPRLTLKMLHSLIQELQQEKLLHSERIYELERKLERVETYSREVAREVAYTLEQLSPSQPEVLEPEVMPGNLVPRSIKFPKPVRKKGVWSRFWSLFAPKTKKA